MKEGREGGWHFGEERGKGGRLNTIEGGDVLSFFFRLWRIWRIRDKIAWSHGSREEVFFWLST